MIRSAAKKKIEASATITKTMMVVIVVSRRVGQVTLALSERTSCMNLNGLKAIADDPSRKDELKVFRNPNSPVDPALVRRMSRQAGSFVRGFKSRAGYPHQAGRQQVGVSTAGEAKGQG